jgi:hypothetical protein
MSGLRAFWQAETHKPADQRGGETCAEELRGDEWRNV